MNLPANIHTSNGKQPHESWGGWEGFLASCEIRDEHDGVRFFGKTNCNYILFPDGLLVCNYGYHGKAMMHEIRDDGREAVASKIKAIHKEVAETVAKLKKSPDS